MASEVWELLQERRTVAEVRDSLLQAFDGVTPEECTAELLRLLDEMVQLELVQVL